MIRTLVSFLVIVFLTTLSLLYAGFKPGDLFSSKEPKATFIAIDSKHKPGKLSYNSVKPILDNRCASCHSGDDAPCQLQLSSYEGLQRGASKQALYETRWDAIAASRLIIDGKTTDDWRKNGFFSVLNEKSQFPEINLNNSLIAKFLVLKRDATDSALPKRSSECPTLEEFAEFAQSHPLAGMPFGLPAMDKAEQDKLMNWLQDGAKNSAPTVLSEAANTEINKWELFFNDSAPAMQLTARYIYEHLFTGHLHFPGQPANEVYRLVRSKTPSGQAIDEVDNLHPFTAPNVGTVYYRLRPITETLLDKTHAVYELSDTKMARIKELFLSPEVTVTQLPAYSLTAAAQPFVTFKDLPVAARQQFLLDDASYFFSAIFKSPALNQHNGLSGFREHFWIAFFKPRPDTNLQTAKFLSENTSFLRFPVAGDASGFAQWFELKALQKQYLVNKAAFTQNVLLKGQSLDTNLLWQGDNSALTVFRHDDNASVVKGWQGQVPSTAWVIDYPMFERLHYLLLAGFNLYGDTAYQASTRLSLDLLRSEAENNFLQFIPKAARKTVHDNWYPGLDSQWLGVFNIPDFAAEAESAISYQSQNYIGEFFAKLPQVPVTLPTPITPPVAPVTTTVATAPTPATTTLSSPPTPCGQEPCSTPAPQAEPILPPPDYDNFARQLSELHGSAIAALPEVAFLRIATANHPEQTVVYTLIRNRQLRHVGILFGEHRRHQAELDTLTVLPGTIGSYPNLFFTITSDQLEAFITQLKQAQLETAIMQFYDHFAIRRNHPQFWSIYDSINRQHQDGRPENAGLFDLNRYGKR